MKLAFLTMMLGYVFPSLASKSDRARDAGGGSATAGAKLIRWVPLLGYVVPTLAIGYGMVIPRSCIAGVNGLTVGFLVSVCTVALAYGTGQYLLIRDGRNPGAAGGAPALGSVTGAGRAARGRRVPVAATRGRRRVIRLAGVPAEGAIRIKT